ncbi:MAG TPA: hypothetical protein VFX20_19160 [Steroidobacteraceae bacterium]|nr:hypothetical protein [Steroidobacteraceae bacterium]
MRPAGWFAEVLLLALLPTAAAIAASPAPAAAPASTPQPGAQWRQVETRIESGYFEQDAAGLASLATTLASGDHSAAGNAKNDPKKDDPKDEEWRSYYSALLAYRLALLAKSDESRAWPHTQRCVQALNHALALDTVSAEALALQSACLALQSRLDPWRSPFAAPLSRSRIAKALKLAPDNPRVLLLGARAACDRPPLFGGDSRQGFELLQRAVSAFERQHAHVRRLPGWGAADAFTDLAHDYLTQGDAVAARNVLERALLVAPHFAEARQLMAEIVSG